MTQEKISELLGYDVTDLQYLTGGQIGDIYKAKLADQNVVIKTARQNTDDLLIEAKMLQDLDENGLNVPKVIAVHQKALVLECIEEYRSVSYDKETEAAKALASLHQVSTKAGCTDTTTIRLSPHFPKKTNRHSTTGHFFWDRCASCPWRRSVMREEN